MIRQSGQSSKERTVQPKLRQARKKLKFRSRRDGAAANVSAGRPAVVLQIAMQARGVERFPQIVESAAAGLGTPTVLAKGISGRLFTAIPGLSGC